MKVAIIGGAGGVGSSLAFNLLQSAHPFEVIVVDSRPNMVVSHVMDLQDTLPLGRALGVRGGDLDDAAEADAVVLCAAVPQRLNTDRSVFFAENVELVAKTVRGLRERGWDGLLVMMTNPVDALNTWLVRHLGLDPRRVIGYSTNDTLRIRTGIALALGVPSRSVEAWVLGEHGAGQVPLLDRVTVDGAPVRLSPEQRAAALDYIDNWYVRHVALESGRASTWSSGLGGARLLEAIRAGSGETLTGSVVLDGQYGVVGVSLGVPIAVGPEGVREVLEWELSADELAAMAASAARVDALASGYPAAPGG
jgi:malate dehydrogenase